MVIETLYELSKGEAIVTTGVGQHQDVVGAVLQVQISAPASDQRSVWARWALAIRRRWSQGPPFGGQVVDNRCDAVVPHERAGTGDGGHIEKIAAKVIILTTNTLGMGDAVGGPLLCRRPRQTLSGRPAEHEADLPGLPP